MPLVLALAIAHAAAQAVLPKALQVKEMHLSNGMTVWLNEDHSQPKVVGAVVVKVGAAHCPNTGIAHYFEHILFKGTDRIGTVDYEAERPWIDSISAQYDRLAATTDAAQRLSIQRDINRLSQKAAQYAVPNDFNKLVTLYGGSDLNAATTYDYTFYHNTFSPQYIRQWALLNSERLLRPVFRLFQGELETVYEEKNMGSDDMVKPVLESIMEKAFEGTPYQYPVIGSTDNLKNPQLSKMRQFYQRYYVASNMGLVLSGSIQADSIMPLLESTFGRLPRGEKAEAPVCQMPAYNQQTYPVKVNVPVISAEMLAFQGPEAGHRDTDVLTMAMQLLNNSSHTGMLDSLMNDSHLLAAIAFNNAMKRGGMVAVGIVPNLLGKKSKAENLCREEIERLKRGDFSDEALALVKRNYEHERISAMEDIGQRAMLMVEVMGNTDLSWDEYVARSQALHNITRADIQRVARQYLGDRYMRFVKKYGTYEKDRLTQPGYQPLRPQHGGDESVFARHLATLPVRQEAPRFVSLDNDAAMRPLATLATLYAVSNPVDSLFSLQLVYHKGKRQDARLTYAADYLEQLGTDSLTLTQFARRMQQLGATIAIKANDDNLKLTLTGRDSQFAPSVRMLAALLGHAKADEKKLKEMKKADKVESKSFGKEPATVAKALMAKLRYGDQSEYLMRMSQDEADRLTSDQLLQAIADARRAQCTVVYSGTLQADEVAAEVCSALSPEMSVEKRPDTDLPLQPVNDNVVYVYRMKDTRQNVVGTYQQLAPTPTWGERADRNLFAEYFAGGMSSVLFQEIREYRSMAYTVGGRSMGPVQALHPDRPTAFATVLSTQADKTMQAVALLDSLLTHMPMRPRNVEVARHALCNAIATSYPNFREIGAYIAESRLDGYTRSPYIDLYDALKEKGPDDVVRFFNDHVRQAPRAFFIIGNLSKAGMAALEKYGRVVELRDEDIVRM